MSPPTQALCGHPPGHGVKLHPVSPLFGMQGRRVPDLVIQDSTGSATPENTGELVQLATQTTTTLWERKQRQQLCGTQTLDRVDLTSRIP